MTIQRKALLEGLKCAMPGIETGNVVLQGSDTFVFHNGTIYSYNDSISVAVPLQLTGLVDDSVEGAVPADEFFKVISKFNGDEINFVISDKGTWILKCGKAKAEISLIDFDFETRLEGITPSEDWIELNDDFITAIGSCKMVNKSKYAGIYFSGNYVLSTDGWQINRYEMKDLNLPDFWISDNGANELLKLKGFTGFQLQLNWVHFKTENGTVFSVKTLNKDNFPFDKVSKILDVSKVEENDLHAVFPKELFNAIDRACSFSVEIHGYTSVKLTLTAEHIEVSSQRATGKYTEKVNWDEGAGISDDFEPVSLYVDSQMMQFMSKRTLEFYMIKGALKNGKCLPRLLFVSPQSKHLMSTFDVE